LRKIANASNGSRPQLAKVWEPPATRTLIHNLDRFPGDLTDPFT
jgi:hypothetical protein